MTLSLVSGAALRIARTQFGCRVRPWFSLASAHPILMLISVVALITVPSCPDATQPHFIARPFAIEEPLFGHQSGDVDFADQARVIARQAGVAAFIIARPAFDPKDSMKIAVIYPSALESTGNAPAHAVVLAPGFSAGAALYLGYACELAKCGYVVFLPDYKGDYVHFFGLELFRDPLFQVDAPELTCGIATLLRDLADYTGNDVDAEFVWQVLEKFREGNIRDQGVADLIRQDLYGYRGYSLDVTVCSVFDVAENADSPLYGRVDTNRIGLESHSMGADEVVQALLRPDGAPQYWWADNIGVAILKGGTVYLHDVASVQTITTPVFFMNGEYDDPSGVMKVTRSRFEALDAPAGYITIANCGHMVFVDPPIGFIVDKCVPVFGQFSGESWDDYTRNRAVIVDVSALVYDAYLVGRPAAMASIATCEVDLPGTFETRNLFTSRAMEESVRMTASK